MKKVLLTMMLIICAFSSDHPIRPDSPSAVTAKPELIVVEKSAPASMAIFYKINSYAVSQTEMMNLEDIAKYIKKSSNKTFKVVGYADNSTGTQAVNARISLRRAQTVADALVRGFGVLRSQLTVESKQGVGYKSDPTLSRMV